MELSQIVQGQGEVTSPILPSKVSDGIVVSLPGLAAPQRILEVKAVNRPEGLRYVVKVRLTESKYSYRFVRPTDLVRVVQGCYLPRRELA